LVSIQRTIAAYSTSGSDLNKNAVALQRHGVRKAKITNYLLTIGA
jgi:hypothetical protein